MGQITDNIIAYREGKITLDALCNFLATFDYQPSGIPAGFVGWQLMYASPSALENTIQEMISTAETLLTTDEYRAVLTAYKAHPPVQKYSDDEPRDVGRADGGQPTAG
jgi:hypothetical protein